MYYMFCSLDLSKVQVLFFFYEVSSNAYGYPLTIFIQKMSICPSEICVENQTTVEKFTHFVKNSAVFL